MNRYVLISAMVGVLFSGSAVYAQVYSNPACVTANRDLSVGSRGADVSSLQQFLVAQNYPGGGSWMVTGYFGAATRVALMNFQTTRGLFASGFLDAQTRAAIARSCSPSFSYAPTNSYAPFVQGAVSLSFLSVSTGQVGTTVTAYGSGFDPLYNSVYLGSSQIANNVPSNGTSLSFTIPASITPACTALGCYSGSQYIAPGTYQVYVSSARGVSGRLPFTVTGGLFGCAYGTFGCGSFGNYGNFGLFAPSISSITPTAGAVGTNVTVFGSGFSARNNSVRFGSGVISGLYSLDGSSLSFTVPSTLTGFGSQTLVPGTYSVSVTNEFGATSNAASFLLTSLAQNTLAPAILSISGPTALPVGSTGVWAVTINNPNNALVTVTPQWGDESINPTGAGGAQSTVSVGQQTLTFTHTYITSGTYTAVFTIVNNTGLRNSASATAIVSSSSSGGQPTLTGLSPVFGRVGTLISIQGSGFTPSGNTVHFGVGGALSLASANNGTIIYFTIPSVVSPCDLLGPGCAAPSSFVTPGTYSVFVTNGFGQTSVMNFTVTQ